jgi:hypothetical protein
VWGHFLKDVPLGFERRGRQGSLRREETRCIVPAERFDSPDQFRAGRLDAPPKISLEDGIL